MNKRLILKLVGTVMLVEAIMLVLPLGVSFLMRSGDHMAFVYTIVVTTLVGGALRAIPAGDDTLHAREGCAIVALSWLLLSFFGAMPFALTGVTNSIIDAFFETVSGFTTTGATILGEIQSLPKGLLFWRSMTHWAGGMGVLVLSLAVIPKMGGGSIYIMRAESSGPSTDKLVPRVGQNAKILYQLYIGMSAALLLALLVSGVGWYDSFIHMFGAAGTGGFSNYNASVAALNNPLAEIILAVFMVLFGINFSIYHYMLHRNWGILKGLSEWKVYLGIVLGTTAVIALDIARLPQHAGHIGYAIRSSFFQVSSIITTTGYATEDFNLWPQLSRVILVGLMFIGGCAGSTAGGLKVVRVQLLLKCAARDIRRTVHPRSVSVIKLDGRTIDEKIISSVQGYFFVAIATMFVSTIVVALDGFDFETTLTSVFATFFNIGPGLSMVGPIGNFAAFSPLSKLVLTVCMLMGRLEIFPLLMLFSPAAWRK